ncbi:MAG: ABC transporter permease [Betaproteobacteria bacterium]|nr:MAG: ABC transporter permease [Betaproteobacteria bacterium]
MALAVAAAGLSRASYTPHARSVTLQQIYFTAWQVLIRVTLFAALLGLVVVQITLSVARDFGLADYALELALRVLVLEVNRVVRRAALGGGDQHRSRPDADVGRARRHARQRHGSS